MISGIVITQLREISDGRGAVLHMLRRDAPGFLGFGECYFSEVQPGAVKAWKRHSQQTQNLAVPIGRIRMVIYDDRADSPTCGQLDSIELGRPDRYFRLTVPPGLWYGFTCVSGLPALLVNCADLPHDPAESIQCPIDDPDIPYDWAKHGGSILT
ncbi:dTDP-4-dehydrorhamnose 3,5-epimerase family protein [Polaromonas sp. AER18D-145]|uniref:dTDP-4-dehydrorhamnose 3,5-epimerase family protein n=1 Tax=Polaromonas sp. AER18D-145 TaxID=1977060 RepID=UPI000BBC3589|nr:dTDP-4-dehydrorhamnose 3,5-epimerase family protein [Polaromonas sp. AER18D-145]